MRCGTLVIIAALLMLGTVEAQPSKATMGHLSDKVEVSLGQLYALHLQNAIDVLQQVASWSAPVIVSFDSEAGLLSVEILGSRNSIDSAKSSIEEFRQKVLGVALIATNSVLGVEIAEEHMSIDYLNKSTFDAVITFRDGTYTIE